MWRKSTFSTLGDCVEINWQKSSFSAESSCVEVAWRKSSHSSAGNCVEVNADDSRVLIRNSNHPDRGILAFSISTIRKWIEGIKAGDLD